MAARITPFSDRRQHFGRAAIRGGMEASAHRPDCPCPWSLAGAARCAKRPVMASASRHRRHCRSQRRYPPRGMLAGSLAIDSRPRALRDEQAAQAGRASCAAWSRRASGRQPNGPPTGAYTIGSSPSVFVRWSSRPQSGSYGMARCMVPVLSHITASPTDQS